MTHKRLCGILFVVLSLVTSECFADAIGTTLRRGWAEPALVDAKLHLNLNDEQRPLFDLAIADYREALESMVRKTIRNNQTRHEQAMRSGNKRLLKSLDEAVESILREDQKASYEAYRATIVDSINLKCSDLRC